MATDCQATLALPLIEAGWAQSSISASTLTSTLPALTAHLSSGVPMTPPLMSGAATVRALAGTVTP